MSGFYSSGGAMAGGPFDLAAIHRGHERFLQRHKHLVEDRALSEAGIHAEHHVRDRSTFKRQSAAGSLKDATESRLIRTASGALVRIYSAKKTAEFIENGTAAHAIVARRAKALRFVVGGQVVFRRRVWHPGTRSYFFLRNAAFSAFLDMGIRVQGHMREIAKTF